MEVIHLRACIRIGELSRELDAVGPREVSSVLKKPHLLLEVDPAKAYRKRRACELAGVEPTFQSLNGHDPVQYIWGANTKRRNMTKGQTAMIAVEGGLLSTKETPSPTGGRPSKGITATAKAVGVNVATIAKALFVKEHAPDLVEEVINSTLSLDEAHSEAEQRAKQVEGGKKGGAASGASRRGETKAATKSSQPSRAPETRKKVAEAAGVSEHKAQH